jgi:hypothetical protein
MFILTKTKTKVIILDPHTTQSAFERTDRPIPLDSFRPSPTLMPIAHVDPSVSVGFVLSSFDQLEELESFFANNTSHLPYSITIEDAVPVSKPVLIADAQLEDWVTL